MTDDIEISRQTVSGMVVSAGTVVEVGSGGDLIDTLVQDGGVLVVSSGGVTSATLLDAGGSQLVANGGTATDTSVKHGGYLAVSSGGTTISAFDSGGTLIVSGGGSDFYMLVSSTAFVSITALVGSGEVSSGLVIGGPGLVDTLDVVSGGVAVSTTVIADGAVVSVFSGGTAEYTSLSGIEPAGDGDPGLVISAGGTAAYTNVSFGGYMVVSSGGSAIDTSVGFDGELIVKGGGSATDIMASPGAAITSSPGAAISVTQEVAAGQMSSGVIVTSYSHLYVEAGGLTTGTMILDGGSELVSSGGTEIGTVVSAGGYDLVSGTSVDTDIGGGYVDVALGGHVSNVTMTDSGTLYLASGDLASGAIVFSGNGTLVIGDGTEPAAVLSGFDSGDTIDDTGLIWSSETSATVAGQTLVIDGANETLVLQLAGDDAGATFTAASDNERVDPFDDHGTLITVSNVPVVVNTVPCFAAGTLIKTDRGAVAVERLSVGDRVLTIEGKLEPILWIGSRAIDCRRHPRPHTIMPVRIRAHTWASGQPGRDLLLSPDHAIFAEGVLIPVKHLLNGSTIAQRPVDAVAYYHVELSRHTVILAEGLPVETYRDTGDRSAFANAGGVTMLHPRFGPAGADIALITEALGYAPLRVTGPEVDRVRRLAQTPAEARSAVSHRETVLEPKLRPAPASSTASYR